MSPERIPDPDCRFVADRMLGTLIRYLRFMGYDTISANGLALGNAKEDTLLLQLAKDEHRILLTRDHELAGRGGDQALLISSDDIMDQIRQLVDGRYIVPRLLMTRCSLCNSILRAAAPEEITGADYAPRDTRNLVFWWCDSCHKLYWNGSHGKQLSGRIGTIPADEPDQEQALRS